MASPMPSQLPAAPASAAPEGSGLPAQPVDPAAAPAPVATTPATVPPAAAPATGVLRFGSRGRDVRALQRKLRVRGIKVRVDGKYGRTTRAGVRILQRKLRVKATGVADAKLLRRLGLKVRVVAGAPATLAGPTSARYLKAFPVLGEYSYFNDFGAPRSQGSHAGNDIVSKMGTPLVACVDGVIHRLSRSETGLGGIWIWIEDAQGNQYYYAHMETIAAELRAGSRVTAGQVVGTMGMTGDARGTIPHLHFEIRPSGGGSINPFSELRAVDPTKR
jgi:murein DD-endopeptidase MepM/ murein hydrolase activator NlpD